jgi:hypothetical protein
VSLAAGVRPEEARAIGWKQTGSVLDEGRLPELVKLQHALMRIADVASAHTFAPVCISLR